MGRGVPSGMRPAFAPLERRSWPIVLLVPVACVAVASGIAWVLPHELLGVPATMYLMAVFASAYARGLWAGVLASVLSVAGLDLIFLPGSISVGKATPENVVLLGVFVLAAAAAAIALQRLRDARSATEEQRARATALAELTAGLAGTGSVTEVGETMATHLTSGLAAQAAGVFLLDRSGTRVSLLAQRGYPADLMAKWRSFGVDSLVPASEAIRERRPILLGSLGERLAKYRAASGDRPTMGAGALAALPIQTTGKPIGAVTLSFPDDHRYTAQDLAFLEALVLEGAQAIERARQREAERRRQERTEFLAEASRALARSLDFERTLEEIAQLAIPRFADWAAVDLLSEEGTIELMAVAHRDPEMVRWARQFRARLAPSLDDPTGVGAVVRTGQSEFYPDLVQEELEETAESDDQLEVIQRLQVRSVIVVPLVAREKALGAMALLLSEGERRFEPEDLEVAEDLAGRAAIAIDNARLYRAETEARAAVEAGDARLRVLSAASRALASSLDLDATLQEVVRVAVAHLADSAIVYLAESSGELDGVAFAHVDPERLPQLERLERAYEPSRNPDSHVMRAFRTGLPQVIEEIDREALARQMEPEAGDALSQLDVGSGLALPLAIGPQNVGVLALAWTRRTRVPPEDLAMAEELARRMARAIENARLYEERDHTARTLQHSLLPPSLPTIPGVQVAARYRAAGATNEVGGDFYDVFEAGGGWILSIGDVCGKGPEAAAVMAIARYTTRALATHETRPSALLAALNGSLLAQSPGDRFCTACCARIHRFEGGHRLTVACGGHPRPLLLRADGSVRTIGRHGTLLGALPTVTLWDEWIDLEPGDTVVFYTDGLERPGEPVEESVGMLLAGLAPMDPESLADEILRAVGEPGSRRADDVALVVIRVDDTAG